MVIRKKTYIFLVFVLIGLLSSDALYAKRLPYARLRGEELYNQGRYLDALTMFEKYEEGKDVVYDEAYLHCKAEVYYKLARFDEAALTYSSVQKHDSENIDYKFFAGLAMRSSSPNDYKDVIAMLDSIDGRGENAIFLNDSLARFEVNPVHLLNTPLSEFGAVEHNGEVYLSLMTNRAFTKKDVNTENTYYDIFSISSNVIDINHIYDDKLYYMLSKEERDTIDQVSKSLDIRPIRSINTKYNNGPISFYNDDVAYLTINEKHRRGIENIYNLTLKKVSLKGDSIDHFSAPIEDYFGKYFSPADVGQITFNSSNTRACMAVKLKDSSTGSDLWFASLTKDSIWSAPVLGNRFINTEQDELFPFWSGDDFLYFSSNGIKGAGGLDVFQVDMRKKFDRPVNVGAGVNSSYDDFAFSIDTEGKGYISSNRLGGRGLDDIYKVQMKYGNVKVILKSDTSWVDEPYFNFNNRRDDELSTFNIKDNPSYLISNIPYGEYNLDHSFPVDTTYKHVSLYDDTAIVYVCFPDIGADTLPVTFTNFCFDCADRDLITQDKFERIVAFLSHFPEIEIELTGNTDMFGTPEYNEALGMRRADVMESWLRDAGIDNVIRKKSNGKRKLVSKVDHELNRRVDVELFWPGDTSRIVAIDVADDRLDRRVILTYDIPAEFDVKIETGYYIMFYKGRNYLELDDLTKKFIDDSSYGTFLYSDNSKVFCYYLKKKFHSAMEAEKFIRNHKLRAKIQYLRINN